MIEFRCRKCKKLLFKGKFEGFLEIKCNKCKEINKVECHIKEHQSK